MVESKCPIEVSYLEVHMSDSGLWVNGVHAASNEADMLIVSNADYFSFGGAQLRDSNVPGYAAELSATSASVPKLSAQSHRILTRVPEQVDTPFDVPFRISAGGLSVSSRRRYRSGAR